MRPRPATPAGASTGRPHRAGAARRAAGERDLPSRGSAGRVRFRVDTPWPLVATASVVPRRSEGPLTRHEAAEQVPRSAPMIAVRASNSREPDDVPKFYLTTAIDYSNGDPHLGHALEKVGADCHRPLPPAPGRRRALPHGDGRALPGGAAGGRAERARAAGLGGPDGRYVRELSGAGSSAATTTGSGPRSRGISGARPRCSSGSRAQSGRSVRGRIRRAVLLRLRGVQAAGPDRRTGTASSIRPWSWCPTKERNHFFRLSRYRDACWT